MAEKREQTPEELAVAEFVRSLRPSYHLTAGSLPSSIEIDAEQLRQAVLQFLTVGFPAAVEQAKARKAAEEKAARAAEKDAAAKATAEAEKAARDAEREAYQRDHPGKPLPKRLLDPETPEGGPN